MKTLTQQEFNDINNQIINEIISQTEKPPELIPVEDIARKFYERIGDTKFKIIRIKE